jgi:4-amino-4-deoxy-L-arabinose transferase-like glycosyltransferase
MPESMLKRNWTAFALIALLAIQALQISVTLHRESLTWDEEDHMYAGYRMWTAGDFGLNPEHPPLVKLLAALPILGEKLWVPPLRKTMFKEEAFLGGRDWLERNDGVSQRLVFRMRLAAALLAIALSLTVFFATREWFGATAAVVALTLLVFDPNILAHSGLVTTDVGAALFFLASLYTFYRYVKQPTMARLAIIGIVMGLLFATKHSGVLMIPILLLIVIREAICATKGLKIRTLLRLSGAFAVMLLLAVGVLWAFYGFRYAARPAGLELIPPMSEYSQGLGHVSRGLILWIARLHLLPESYLMGVVDIRIFAKDFSTYALGTWYPHGVWWYFPVALSIKTTLGMLALVLLAGSALITGKLVPDSTQRRALAYLLIAAGFYLAFAMWNGVNIGVRHVLPFYAFAAVLLGATVAALSSRSRVWMYACALLVVAHIASGLAVFPNSLAYANEAWGGAWNTHRLLNDSNVDWGRQLYQVREWEAHHPGEECWFAYNARPFIRPETYGVHCHVLPNGLGGAGDEMIPPTIHGTLLLSAGEVDGSLWPSQETNPYRQFQTLQPNEEIDYSVLVYRGDFSTQTIAGVSRAFLANDALDSNQPKRALQLAQEAVKLAPDNLFTQWALGDAATACGEKGEARVAYQAAITATNMLDSERRALYTKHFEKELQKLQQPTAKLY